MGAKKQEQGGTVTRTGTRNSADTYRFVVFFEFSMFHFSNLVLFPLAILRICEKTCGFYVQVFLGPYLRSFTTAFSDTSRPNMCMVVDGFPTISRGPKPHMNKIYRKRLSTNLRTT